MLQLKSLSLDRRNNLQRAGSGKRGGNDARSGGRARPVCCLASPHAKFTVQALASLAAPPFTERPQPEAPAFVKRSFSVPATHEVLVPYLGSERVEGAALFMMLSPSATVRNVLELCQEICGRSPAPARFSGAVRPVSFTLPDGRMHWDPATEELPPPIVKYLHAPAVELGCPTLSVQVQSVAHLTELRRELLGVVELIEHQDSAQASHSNAL